MLQSRGLLLSVMVLLFAVCCSVAMQADADKDKADKAADKENADKGAADKDKPATPPPPPPDGTPAFNPAAPPPTADAIERSAPALQYFFALIAALAVLLLVCYPTRKMRAAED